MGLRGRLRLLLALVMLPSFLLLVWNANEHRLDAMKEARTKAFSLAEIGAAHEDDVIQEVQDVFRVLGRVPQVTEAGHVACGSVLAGVVADHRQILFLATTDRAGRIVCSSLPALVGADISAWPNFNAISTPGGPTFALGRLGAAAGLPSENGLAAMAPLPRAPSGAATGAFIAEIDLRWLTKLAAQIASDPEDRVAIIDPDSSRVLVSLPPLPASAGNSAARYPALTAFLRSRKDGVVEGAGPDAKSCIYGYASMQSDVGAAPSTPAILSVGLSRGEVVGETARQMAISIGLAILVLGTGIFIVGWLAETRLLQPMQRLTRTAARLSDGNLDARVNLSKIPMKEMRILGSAFNTMAGALQQLALVDSLTGIANRRRFDQVIESEARYANRFGQTLSLLMIDADRFKAFNDHYGHVAGDNCLRRIAEALKQTGKRSTDLVARYGGEEFAILLPSTDQDAALDLARELLDAVRALAIPHAKAPNGIVTISIGLGTRTAPPAIAASDLVQLADEALYAAKLAGRDTIVIGAGPTPAA